MPPRLNNIRSDVVWHSGNQACNQAKPACMRLRRGPKYIYSTAEARRMPWNAMSCHGGRLRRELGGASSWSAGTTRGRRPQARGSTSTAVGAMIDPLAVRPALGVCRRLGHARHRPRDDQLHHRRVLADSRGLVSRIGTQCGSGVGSDPGRGEHLAHAVMDDARHRGRRQLVVQSIQAATR